MTEWNSTYVNKGDEEEGWGIQAQVDLALGSPSPTIPGIQLWIYISQGFEKKQKAARMKMGVLLHGIMKLWQHSAEIHNSNYR